MKRDFVQCVECGTVYESDYFRDWGRKYGHGLGSRPVCEALSTDYTKSPVWPDGNPAAAMHPVGVCKGNVIPVQLDEDTEVAITAVEDPHYTKRAVKMQSIQRKKSPELDLHLKTIKL